MLKNQFDETSLERQTLDDVRVEYLDQSELNRKSVANVCNLADGVALLIAFISSACDMSKVGEFIKRCLPVNTKFMMISTAGELCHFEGKTSIYPPNQVGRKKIVLQAFSNRMITDCQIFTIDLPNDDLLKNESVMTPKERTDIIVEKLKKQPVSMSINAQDTVALAYIDGMAKCETFVMQAVYDSQKFPCIFVGGSSGNDEALGSAYLYDGERLIENHLMVCLLKINSGYKFGMFKSQGFCRTENSFIIADGNPSLRYVSKVLDEQGRFVDFIDALKLKFSCKTIEELEKIIYNYSFAIDVNGEIFARTILKIDEIQNRVYFYCDIGIGEKLLVIHRASFLETLQRDWDAFMKNKPKPFAGILNDCITRRVVNSEELHKMNLFKDITIGGFSCFGEFMGIPLNDTLTSVFFFKVDKNASYEDKYYDYFPIYYAEFKGYFLLRRLKQVQIVNDLEKKVLEILNEYRRAKKGEKSEQNKNQMNIDMIFSSLITDFNYDKVLERQYQDNRKVILDTFGEASDEEKKVSYGEIGTLISYMQMALDKLSSQRKRLEKKVQIMEESMSRYTKDELTDVYTRRSGYEIIHQLLNNPISQGTILTFAFIDLDNLKIANDYYGHEEGDEYLRTVVGLLKEKTQPQDIICRYGGDEFIIVFSNRNEKKVITLLERINKNLNSLNKTEKDGYQRSFAFGVLEYTYRDELTFDEIMQILDARMYQHKSKNKILNKKKMHRV